MTLLLPHAGVPVTAMISGVPMFLLGGGWQQLRVAATAELEQRQAPASIELLSCSCVQRAVRVYGV